MGSQLPETTSRRGCLFLVITLFLFIFLIPTIVKSILDLHYQSYVQGTCTILSEEILTFENDGPGSDSEGPFYIPLVHFTVWISDNALQTEGNPLHSYGNDQSEPKFGENAQRKRSWTSMR